MMYIGKIYNADLQSIDNFHDVHIRKRPIYLTKKIIRPATMQAG